MDAIDQLIEADRRSPKDIAVLGDTISDVLTYGDLLPSQDGCMKFMERRTISTPGGAAGAARQLHHWNALTALLSLVRPSPGETWNQVPLAYAHDCRRMPVKHRFLDAHDRIVFRHDLDNGYGLDAEGMAEVRRLSLLAIQVESFDAVLISDYEKGFTDERLIRDVIDKCRQKDTPVVADAKRTHDAYDGALLKFNRDYGDRYGQTLNGPPLTPSSTLSVHDFVETRGPQHPAVWRNGRWVDEHRANPAPVILKSHVGAGDCFAAHLVLALAHGLSLADATAIAHSAGRVYVQHAAGRPPYPFEIRKDMKPSEGKLLSSDDAASLRQSLAGRRLIFANGCFRVPSLGHAKMLEWARAQGDVLVLGVNSDASVRALKPNQFCLPWTERAAILASFSSVDWLIPFDELDPCALMTHLKPDTLVKGQEFEGRTIPGADLASQVLLAPMIKTTRPARLITPTVVVTPATV